MSKVFQARCYNDVGGGWCQQLLMLALGLYISEDPFSTARLPAVGASRQHLIRGMRCGFAELDV